MKNSYPFRLGSFTAIRSEARDWDVTEDQISWTGFLNGRICLCSEDYYNLT